MYQTCHDDATKLMLHAVGPRRLVEEAGAHARTGGPSSANATRNFPPLKDTVYSRLEIIECKAGTIVGFFAASSQVLGVCGDCDLVNKPSTVRWAHPYPQFHVRRRSDKHDNSYSALLVRTEGVMEMILNVRDLSRTRILAPRKNEAWVLLKAIPGHCWVNGLFDPRQYDGDRKCPVVPMAHLRESLPAILNLPWNSDTFAQVAAIRPCAPGNLVIVRPVTGPSVELQVTLTTVGGAALWEGGWTGTGTEYFDALRPSCIHREQCAALLQNSTCAQGCCRYVTYIRRWTWSADCGGWRATDNTA